MPAASHPPGNRAESRRFERPFQSGWRPKYCSRSLALLATGYLLGYRGTLQWLGWVSINQALLSAVLYVRAGRWAQANTEPTHGYPLPTSLAAGGTGRVAFCA